MHGEMKDSQVYKVISKKMDTAAQCLLVAIAEKATFERKLPKRPVQVVPVTLTISMHWSVILQCNATELMQACEGEENNIVQSWNTTQNVSQINKDQSQISYRSKTCICEAKEFNTTYMYHRF